MAERELNAFQATLAAKVAEKKRFTSQLRNAAHRHASLLQGTRPLTPQLSAGRQNAALLTCLTFISHSLAKGNVRIDLWNLRTVSHETAHTG
jgi:hypothetical protein